MKEVTGGRLRAKTLIPMETKLGDGEGSKASRGPVKRRRHYASTVLRAFLGSAMLGSAWPGSRLGSARLGPARLSSALLDSALRRLDRTFS